jgi:1-aminocyclopropane-1-carboxylate deaminase/D-cysteine desulfhydrase-like pyridoxal-dependent ACC family enzyme
MIQLLLILMSIIMIKKINSTCISSITKVNYKGKSLYIKRDDQYHLRCLNGIDDIKVNGNKTRKFLKLHQQLSSSSSSLREIRSYGGIQSNSMVAIAAITNYHKCKFTYYTKKINDLQRYKDRGNYAVAFNYGMNHIQLSNEEYNNLNINQNNDIIDDSIKWIPQGGSYSDAYDGVKELVEELVGFISSQSEERKKWKIVFSSGTGTTALFAATSLARYTKQSNLDIEVVAIPCVGTKEYLLEQMINLDNNSGNNGIFPTILSTTTLSKRIFGKPIKEHYLIWSELLKETGITFDLIYAPRAFELLFESYAIDKEYWNDTTTIYYHCGGLEGNDSQLERYRYSNLI